MLFNEEGIIQGSPPNPLATTSVLLWDPTRKNIGAAQLYYGDALLVKTDDCIFTGLENQHLEAFKRYWGEHCDW